MCTRSARALRKNPTDAERHLWRRIRRKQLNSFKFRRQYPIGTYIVDFICLKARLIIELGGGQHMIQAAYDRKRDLWLENQGFRVIRFWNNEVLEHTDGVLQRIMNALNEAS
jgi:very-short-patch-repair endonuclease